MACTDTAWSCACGQRPRQRQEQQGNDFHFDSPMAWLSDVYARPLLRRTCRFSEMFTTNAEFA